MPENITESNYKSATIKLSKKYSFSLISFVLFFYAIRYSFLLDYPLKEKIIVTIALLICILVVTIAYLTGQAKIDLNVSGGINGRKN